MTALEVHLATLPHRDLRAVATRLGVRTRGEHRKEQWRAAVGAAWRDPASRQRLLSGLSPDARHAAARLARAGEMPAPLFLAQYGPLRRAMPGRAWSPPPWEQPATVAEELYYAGLLCPRDPPAIGRARRVSVPAELRAELAALLPEDAAAETSLGVETDPAAQLLHDVIQTLLYLAAQPGQRLLHGRWLSAARLAPLNDRLLRPDPSPITTHKRSPRLRFLIYLLRAAGLWEDGHVTPTGYAWLAAPAFAQLKSLWEAWRDAPLQLRQIYEDPGRAVPAPWPGPLLEHLSRRAGIFGATELADALWGETALAIYFTANLPDLRALDALVAATLQRLEEDWGVLQIASDLPTYALTPTGRRLLALDPPVPDDRVETNASAETPAILEPDPPDAWQLTLSAYSPGAAFAALALHAIWAGLDRAGAPPRHTYRFSERSVAAAAAAGHGLPALLDALATLGVNASPAFLSPLAAWRAHGGELQLATLPILRAASPEVMSRVFNDAAARPALGELLAPGVALLALPPEEAAERLAAAGFYPDQTRLSIEGAAGDRTAAESGALWLAGQLYAALRDHLALPLPPPYPALRSLLAALPPAQQAALQAQWEVLHGRLLALLDGQAFTPPPQPGDSAQWQPLIEAAIAAGCSLQITYFTAGRNLLTRRTVTPLWIEAHRGVPYLRADCHLAGRIRLFRLDRIMEMDEV